MVHQTPRSCLARTEIQLLTSIHLSGSGATASYRQAELSSSPTRPPVTTSSETGLRKRRGSPGPGRRAFRHQNAGPPTWRTGQNQMQGKRGGNSTVRSGRRRPTTHSPGRSPDGQKFNARSPFSSLIRVGRPILLRRPRKGCGGRSSTFAIFFTSHSPVAISIAAATAGTPAV